MANSEHLAILRQGVKVWNKWREKNPQIKPDLRGAKLKDENLEGVNFSNTHIQGTNFANSILKNANFTNAEAGITKKCLINFVFVIALLVLAILSSSAIISIAMTLIFAAIITLLCLPRKVSNKSIFLVVTISLTIIQPISLFLALMLGFVVLNFDIIPIAIAGFAPLALTLSFWTFLVFRGTKAGLIAVIVDKAGSGIIRTFIAMLDEFFKIAIAETVGTNFRYADLSNANFTRAIIDFTNLKGAELDHVCWANTKKLARAFVTKSYLNKPHIRKLVTTNAGQRQNFSNLNLAKINLQGANLQSVNFSRTNLNGANLKNANLAEANLIQTQLDETDLTKAILTAAVIEDWNINSETNLDNVICDYVYLKQNQQERRPHDPNKNFAPGEFAKLFQEAIETVDLIFSNGIDWQAFLFSFQKLQIECNSDELAIQAIERKSGNSFVVRVEVPPDANKAEIEKFFKRKYGLALKAKEEQYKELLQAKDKDITYFRQQNTDLMEIIKLQASKPINISQVQGNNMAGDHNIQMGSGNYNERIEGDYVQGNQFNSSQQNLAEAAAEIQALLKQLEEAYPTDSTASQMVVAAKAVEQIEGNPTLKQKAISAVKEGGIAAFEKAIDNPAGAFIAGAVKGWQEVK